MLQSTKYGLLLARLKERGHTLVEACRKANVSQPTLRRIACGTIKPAHSGSKHGWLAVLAMAGMTEAEWDELRNEDTGPCACSKLRQQMPVLLAECTAALDATGWGSPAGERVGRVLKALISLRRSRSAVIKSRYSGLRSSWRRSKVTMLLMFDS